MSQIGPVLKRADSFKHIGSSVLDSRVSTYAADRIDKAIDAADVYVEKYLPAEDQVDCELSNSICFLSFPHKLDEFHANDYFLMVRKRLKARTTMKIRRFIRSIGVSAFRGS